MGRAGGSVPGQAGALHALVAEVDAALSRFRPDSDVGRLNQAAGAWVPVGEHLVAVARAAERYRVETGGVFSAVTAADGAGRALRLRPAGARGWEARLDDDCQVDFGAIAKGYAADLVRDRAAATGVLASLGTSSVSVGGDAPRGGAWRIALGSPWHELDETLGYLEVPCGSFSMSGIRGHRLGVEPVVVRHVRDPRTGEEAHTDLCSVAVVSDDGMRSEAISTAALVLGLEDGMALCRRLGVDAVFLTASGRLFASPGLASRIALRPGIEERLTALRP
ncbi:FAD:protein FMN transferase [Tessaracoccus caeni]|uniref:FAD:protein FMN transferase n=1 Tax=Tessaracoccus caeni TaxID=3031239 RepID=UPI0023DBC569|nr:FAD:protein FMN transferase [Tessaracoccus caeni]MDF1487863.1 FAD:protein FMN transferase [Tessaracoccus caeni]